MGIGGSSIEALQSIINGLVALKGWGTVVQLGIGGAIAVIIFRVYVAASKRFAKEREEWQVERARRDDTIALLRNENQKLLCSLQQELKDAAETAKEHLQAHEGERGDLIELVKHNTKSLTALAFLIEHRLGLGKKKPVKKGGDRG